MDSSASATPAGMAIGQKPQNGAQKALALGLSDMLPEGPKAEGGLASKRSLVVEEVHSPQNPQGMSGAVPHLMNPPKKDKTSAHPESQFSLGQPSIPGPPETSWGLARPHRVATKRFLGPCNKFVVTFRNGKR